MPLEIVAALVLAISGFFFLVLRILGYYWEERFMTEARRMEIEAENTGRKDKKPGRRSVSTTWLVAYWLVVLGLPVVLVFDGLVFRVGVGLYSPYLSFFSPVDSYMQYAGIVLSAVGLAVFLAAWKPVVKCVYAKAEEERSLITTGIYAYVRHPMYTSYILLPVGLILLTLNGLALLLTVPFWVWLDESDSKPRFVFFVDWVEQEEQALLKTYGEKYEEYSKRTGRFLPKIRK